MNGDITKHTIVGALRNIQIAGNIIIGVIWIKHLKHRKTTIFPHYWSDKSVKGTVVDQACWVKFFLNLFLTLKEVNLFLGMPYTAYWYMQGIQCTFFN